MSDPKNPTPAKQMVALSPLHDNLLLEPIPAADRSGGGIIIPEAHIKPLNQGKVVDKGPLVSERIELGDIMFFPLHSEHRLDYAGKKFIVVTESACLGCIRKVK